MTRETKIGLLVGLAFIIVIGILLSDHINTTTEPPPAAWAAAYGSAQASVGSPDARNQGNVTVVPPPAPLIPQDRVLTQHDPVPQTDDGSAKVSIGYGGNPSAIRTPVRPVDPPSDSHVQIYPPQPHDAVAANTGGEAATSGTDFTGPLNNLVQQNAGELQPLRPPVGVLNPPPALPNPAAGHQVKAEEGDTVTKLAVKYMGGNSKANREAIIKANPSMTADGHLVFAGRAYTIPVAAAQAPASAAVTNAGQPAPRPVAEPATPRLAPGTTLYTVKDNDSLWKIASEQLGSGTRWQELRDLNADVLKGSEQVRVNMRLKLPAKTVASTN